MERYETFPGRIEDFERAQYALRIARPQSRRRCRIAAHELAMQFGYRDACRTRAHLRAHVLRHWRNRRNPLRQELEIKPCAANKNRQALRSLLFVERARRGVQPTPGRIIDRAVDMTIKPVRNLALIFGAWPR